MSFLSARKKAGYSQAFVAEKLGIAPASVCQWETGKTMPRASMLVRIADLYGCAIDELLSDDDTSSQQKYSPINRH
ncbi:MAG: helix-turn-helix domain-containing protein [Clostridiales bacterium]|nr:helix-turn-helix domain-containing protein [Clostridiales bacterium]